MTETPRVFPGRLHRTIDRRRVDPDSRLPAIVIVSPTALVGPGELAALFQEADHLLPPVGPLCRRVGHSLETLPSTGHEIVGTAQRKPAVGFPKRVLQRD